ncbi:MAG: Sodium:galactoside symporter family protein [Firmicutes bacterium]|nr:Sodium:galactoside symporter family protein [Bacillota bacterium]MDI6707024.1 MFS transporter [Bacillota bacterium]
MDEKQEKLPVISKLFFGAGDLGGSLSATIVGLFYLYFLTDVTGLRPALAGTAILIGRVWDAVTDPVIGAVSDRTVSKWGRRRVYLLFGFVPFGITFFMLWAIPKGLGQLGLFLYATLTFVLHMTAFTVIQVPYQTLTAEMTTDYDERTSLTAYRMAFSIIGGLIAAIIPWMIISGFSIKAYGFMAMGGVFSIAIGMAPLFPLVGCRESGSGACASFSLVKGVRLMWNNKPFRLVLVMFLVTWTAIDLLQVMFVYFLQYWLGMEAQLESIFGLIFIVAIFFLPMWVYVSGRLGKRLAYIIGVGSLGLVLTALIFLKPGMVAMVYVLAFLAGIGVSAAHIMPHSIIPDCIEYDRLMTGQRREGLYYGYTTFLQKVATAVAVGLSGMILDKAGYVAGADQPARVLWTIRILLGPVPGIMFVIGIMSMYYYSIDRKRHHELTFELIAREKNV